jgi:hypothetical protein
MEAILGASLIKSYSGNPVFSYIAVGKEGCESIVYKKEDRCLEIRFRGRSSVYYIPLSNVSGFNTEEPAIEKLEREEREFEASLERIEPKAKHGSGKS